MCIAPTYTLHIRRYRKARRLGQAALAARTGLAYRRIWRLENQQCDPRLSELITLAEALGTTVEELYEVHPSEHTPQEVAHGT